MNLHFAEALAWVAMVGAGLSALNADWDRAWLAIIACALFKILAETYRRPTATLTPAIEGGRFVRSSR